MNSKLKLFFTPLVITTLIVSCNWTNRIEPEDAPEKKKWKLGWRLISSSWNKNYALGEQQFDSLLKMTAPIETKFLITGLEMLSALGKKDKMLLVLGKQDQQTLEEICSNELFTRVPDIQLCKSVFKTENVENKGLQIELIKMYINDQSARGRVLTNIISKYALDGYQVTKMDAVSIDKMNRDRLKQIIIENGFPTRLLVGKDAMRSVFLIIQHSDGDKQWQKEQLPNIARAVKQGDIEGEGYAYLYDRIKINGGEKQLYGTQFKNVDPINKKVELADTEDIENLDTRRMELGMMPIQLYKQFTLRYLSK